MLSPTHSGAGHTCRVSAPSAPPRFGEHGLWFSANDKDLSVCSLNITISVLLGRVVG
jgi:hypothetical protein